MDVKKISNYYITYMQVLQWIYKKKLATIMRPICGYSIFEMDL
jgi:hypothetical protein